MICDNGQLEVVEDNYDRRGACADEVGHVLVAESMAANRGELADSIWIGPSVDGQLTQASTTYQKDDVASLVLSLFILGRVLADETGFSTVESIVTGTKVIVDPGSLRERGLARAHIAAGGPILRAIDADVEPVPILDRVHQGGYSVGKDRIWLSDSIRTLSILYFLHAPPRSLAEVDRTSQWDFVDVILNQVLSNAVLRGEICGSARMIYEKLLEVIGSHPQRRDCVDYVYERATSGAVIIKAEQMLTECGVALSSHRGNIPSTVKNDSTSASVLGDSA